MSTNPTPAVGDEIFYHHATSDGQPRGDHLGVITAVHPDNLVDVTVKDGDAEFSRSNVPCLNPDEARPLEQKFCRLTSTLQLDVIGGPADNASLVYTDTPTVEIHGETPEPTPEPVVTESSVIETPCTPEIPPLTT